jgi:hypothetical protein
MINLFNMSLCLIRIHVHIHINTFSNYQQSNIQVINYPFAQFTPGYFSGPKVHVVTACVLSAVLDDLCAAAACLHDIGLQAEAELNGKKLNFISQENT